jgi:hypothetical protein
MVVYAVAPPVTTLLVEESVCLSHPATQQIEQRNQFSRPLYVRAIRLSTYSCPYIRRIEAFDKPRGPSWRASQTARERVRYGASTLTLHPSEAWRIRHDIQVRTPCGMRIYTGTATHSCGRIHAMRFARLDAGAVESFARFDDPGDLSQSRRDSRYHWRHGGQATGSESRFRQCDHPRFDQDCNLGLVPGKGLLT